jgi:urease accessory protein
MTRITPRSLALPALAGLAISLLSALPAGAHGGPGASAMAGALHPLLGLDHLLLLVGVGLTAARFGPQQLLLALGGALVGSLLGSFGGQLPGAETLAAMAVCGLGVALLVSLRRAAAMPLLGPVLAAGMAIHGLLHGQESSGTPLWWLGALLSSALVAGASLLAGRQLNAGQLQAAAAALALLGGALSLAPL